ncbi:MAG: SRPBCC family protein [Alphaproteobacteria bacterium]|nr:SRPBCC family protein [Alphaproteobacteria bacterium]
MFSFILLIVLGGFAYYVHTQPEAFRITRSLEMNAAPEAIFKHVNNLKLWDAWSPWAKLDPQATNSFSGPDAGVGAQMKWAGNMKVGVGGMSIVESTPAQSVKFRLDFEKPMRATNQAEFTFQATNGKTMVIWSMSGKNNFMGKAMSIIMNCDKMVGGQFEQGLAALKQISEAA